MRGNVATDVFKQQLSFTMKFQQYSVSCPGQGPGEDTAFYQHHALASLNEVEGGDPARFGISVEEFHAANQRRCQEWPFGMLFATSTHDTKRERRCTRSAECAF